MKKAHLSTVKQTVPRNTLAGSSSVSHKSGERRGSAGRNKRRRKSSSLFRRLPSWVVVTSIVATVAIYIFIFVRYFVDPFSFRWNAIYGDAVTPDGYEVRGIDISHYQDRINWAELRNATIDGRPLRFVFIKATEGCDIIDENFNENFYQARQNELFRGAYHFFSPKTDALRQARFFLKQVHLEPGDLPPVLDVEKAEPLSSPQLRKAVLTWLQAVEEHYHVKPIIYTGYRFKMLYLNDSVFNQYPYWIAHYYVPQLEYKGAWAFWQYTDVGSVRGIAGHVDCNTFSGSLQDLQALTITQETLDEIDL